MPVLDLYGRSNDPRAAFGYPSTVMPLLRGPKLFVQLPSGANRIYGTPSQRMVMEEETRVQLDPTSTFEYTQRNHGLGGLRGPTSGFADAMTRFNENLALRKARSEAFKDLHPNVVSAQKTVVELMQDSPILTGTIALLVAALAITTLKTTGKFFG